MKKSSETMLCVCVCELEKSPAPLLFVVDLIYRPLCNDTFHFYTCEHENIYCRVSDIIGQILIKFSTGNDKTKHNNHNDFLFLNEMRSSDRRTDY